MNNPKKLFLAHVPSALIPGGYHSSPKDKGGLQEVCVSSLSEAIVKFCAFVGRNGLSGANLPSMSGVIEDDSGNREQRVLFSGKIIEVGAKENECG